VLGDLLLKTAIQGQTRVIVETHSEHLLARIQRRVAESDGGALAKNVAVYYFEPTSDGTKIQRIELDEYGHLTEPIPSGFFEEGLTEAVEHMKAVSERKKKRDSGL
jgi:predicted ATPase